MRRMGYLLREAIANVLTNRTTTVVAIVTTAFTFACVGVFLLLYVNLRSMAQSLERDIQVLVYVQDDLSQPDLGVLEERLKQDRAVASLVFVSKEQARTDFENQFPMDSHLLDGLGDNPLPASYVVTMDPLFRSSDAVRRWAERARSVPGVSQVQYSQDWVDTLEAIVRGIEMAAIVVGVILSAASVTIIANTIRLTLYVRREELEILGLIGATKAFIRVPYLVEGATLGVLGSAFSLGILKMGFELFRHQIQSTSRFLGVDALIMFFPPHVSVMLLIAGLLLGFTGSYVSLLQFGGERA